MADEHENYHEESLSEFLIDLSEDRVKEGRDLKIYSSSKLFYVVQEGEGEVRLRLGKRVGDIRPNFFLR